MKFNKPIIIVLGEPNSVFSEILAKELNKKTTKKIIKNPLILIGSKKLIYSQLKLLKRNIIFEVIQNNKRSLISLKNKIYLIDVEYNFKKPFENITFKSKNYISQCFKEAIKILDFGLSNVLINGPISKRYFLEKKYPGITEYVFHNSKNRISDAPVMLIYNKKFSVSPVTTHIPLKMVSKKISKRKIYKNILEIYNFYKNKMKIRPKIALLGLNPHCETKSRLNEENKFLKPAINALKKRKIFIDGPFPADTFFLSKNTERYDSVIGMYHDQVLTPFKTIFGFDAVNLTLGLPFLRLSVDHGPNESMMGKNKSNSKSLENIFKFIHSIK